MSQNAIGQDDLGLAESRPCAHLVATVAHSLKSSLAELDTLLHPDNADQPICSHTRGRLRGRLEELSSLMVSLGDFCPLPSRGDEQSDLIDQLWRVMQSLHPLHSDRGISWRASTEVDSLPVCVPQELLHQALVNVVTYLEQTASDGACLTATIQHTSAADPHCGQRNYLVCTVGNTQDVQGVLLRHPLPPDFTVRMARHIFSYYGYAFHAQLQGGGTQFHIMIPTDEQGVPLKAGDPHPID